MAEVSSNLEVNTQRTAKPQAASGSTSQPKESSTLQLETNQFKKLNKDVLVYYPDLTSTHWHEAKDFKNDPRLIMIFSFMSASTRTMVVNFATGYHKLYPAATIVIVKMRPITAFQPQSMKERHLKPAETIYLEAVAESRRANEIGNGVLFHIMSNGGAFRFDTFSAMVERDLSKNPLSASPPANSFPLAFVFDSLPGGNEYESLHSFTIGVKNPFMQFVLNLFMLLLYAVVSIVYAIFRVPMPFSTMRARLARTDPIPGASAETKRVYFYGTADTQIPVETVESHLTELRSSIEKAIPKSSGSQSIDEFWSKTVKVEKYEGGKHVRHFKDDPIRYWNAVQGVWGGAAPKHWE